MSDLGTEIALKCIFLLLLLLFYFLAVWQGMWNLGSPTRDQPVPSALEEESS